MEYKLSKIESRILELCSEDAHGSWELCVANENDLIEKSIINQSIANLVKEKLIVAIEYESIKDQTYKTVAFDVQRLTHEISISFEGNYVDRESFYWFSATEKGKQCDAQVRSVREHQLKDSVIESISKKSNYAGVFEFDGETAYFYLCTVSESNIVKIVDYIHIFSGMPDFNVNDFKVVWSEDDKKVGLFKDKTLVAVFDVESGRRFGGNLITGKVTDIPENQIFYIESK